MNTENLTTALIKTTQSPALARVSNQLALTDKLLTKSEEPFLIPYRKGSGLDKWGFGGMKTRIISQQDMLFTGNSNPPGTSTDGQTKYTLQFGSVSGVKRVLNNRKVHYYHHACISVSEIELIAILKGHNLLIEGKPVADLKMFPENILELYSGYYGGFQIVTHEELTPRYEGQPTVGNLPTKKTYIDKDGNPIYRNNRIYFVEGYAVKDSKGEIIYNSDQDINLFISQWENCITEITPGIQAFKKAFFVSLDNADSKIVLLTSDRIGRIEIPDHSYLIAGSRAMSDEEVAMHIRWNQNPINYDCRT